MGAWNSKQLTKVDKQHLAISAESVIETLSAEQLRKENEDLKK